MKEVKTEKKRQWERKKTLLDSNIEGPVNDSIRI